MKRKPTAKDFSMLTDARDRLVKALRRFDLYPNRGIDLAYQPRGYRKSGDPIVDEISCRHDVPWTTCTVCSRPARRP